MLLSDFEIAIVANVTLEKSIYEQNFPGICTLFLFLSLYLFLFLILTGVGVLLITCTCKIVYFSIEGGKLKMSEATVPMVCPTLLPLPKT